ncbi:YbaB/EbfC family DNA-binding protein [Candidatus Parcubacteria bacterium]|nr:MAG: YbaB/EbfC family DNA-binding protein [Candidatus Parcubacteria bacterium]
MFDKLKQLNELRKMKNAIQAESVEVEKNGVRIKINGSLNIEDISISPEAMDDSLPKTIKQCFNDAVGKMQMILAQKFSGMMG